MAGATLLAHMEKHHVDGYTAYADNNLGIKLLNLALKTEINERIANALRAPPHQVPARVYAFRQYVPRGTLEFTDYPATTQTVIDTYPRYRTSSKGMASRQLTRFRTFLSVIEADRYAEQYLCAATDMVGPWSVLVEVDGVAIAAVAGADRRVSEIVTLSKVDVGLGRDVAA